MLKCIKSLEQFNQSTLPFFARENYLKTLSENYGWFKSEQFLLPFIERKKYIFRFVTFTNETIRYSDLSDVNRLREEKEFLEDIIKYLRGKRIDFITQPPTNVLFKTYPDKSIYTEFGTYIVNLQNDEETLFKNIHPKHRNVIRKASRDGIIIERGYKFKDICFNIISDTLQIQGIKFQVKPEYDRTIELIKDNTEMFVAKYSNQYEGAAIIPWDKYTAYYLYGGSITNYQRGSMNLLQWEAMKYFKSIGVKEYNFVGARINPDIDSKQFRIKDFKKRFGGEMKTGYLWKYNFNPIKKSLFDNLIFLKTGKRPSDIIDTESQKLSEP